MPWGSKHKHGCVRLPWSTEQGTRVELAEKNDGFAKYARQRNLHRSLKPPAAAIREPKWKEMSKPS